MSLHGGALLNLEDKVIGAIVVSLPASCEVGNPFTVLFLSSQQQSLFDTSRFDVHIDTASVENGVTTISAAHTRYIFKLNIYPDVVDVSVQLDLGILAPCKLARLATYVDGTYHLGDTHVYAQTSQSWPGLVRPITAMMGFSITTVIVPSAPSHIAKFYMLELKATGQIDVHDCTVEENSEGVLQLYVNKSQEEPWAIHGIVHDAYDGIDVYKTQHGKSSSFELRRLKKNSAPSISRAVRYSSSVVNNLGEIVQCTLQETGNEGWLPIIEASTGLGMGAVGLLTAISSVSAAIAAFPVIPVVLGTIGMVLAARGFSAAVNSLDDSESACLFPGDALVRSASSNNDLIVLRVHIHNQLELVIASYRQNEIGFDELTLKDMIHDKKTTKTLIFRFSLFSPQMVVLYRAIRIPNFIPTEMSPSDSDTDIRYINGSLVKYSENHTVSEFFEASNCFSDHGAIANFKYSSKESSYIIQTLDTNFGYRNKILRLPQSSQFVVALYNLSITGPNSQYLGETSNPEVVIGQNTRYNIFVSRPVSGKRNQQQVRGYEPAGPGAVLRPDDSATFYFIVADWVPFQAFVSTT